MEIDLFHKNFVPVVRTSGMNLYGLGHLADHDRNEFVLKSTGERFIYIDQLKHACRFGVDGVLATYSNLTLHQLITLTIGRITRVEFPQLFGGAKTRLVAAPKAAAIMGDIQKHECVFPHYQYSDTNSVNITCSAFDQCPTDFSPDLIVTFYFAAISDDPAVSLLHDSLWHFSQNDADKAVIFLYASLETAISKITNNYLEGKNSTKIHTYLNDNKLHVSEQDRALLRKIKKHTEKLSQLRGRIAHKGQHVGQAELLRPYADLVDLYANYDRLLKH